MKKIISGIKSRLHRLHSDEQGADMVEYILIIAAVALPLLAVFVWFRGEIWEWVSSQWEDIKDTDNMTTTP